MLEIDTCPLSYNKEHDFVAKSRNKDSVEVVCTKCGQERVISGGVVETTINGGKQIIHQTIKLQDEQGSGDKISEIT